MKITTQMANAIETKDKLNQKLNELIDQSIALEIKERTKRTDIMNQLANDGVKRTEKAKIAICDAELKIEMNQLTHLKKDIGKIRREIELCDDKISLARNMIRELEILK